MRILDRYILREYLRTFLLGLLFFVGLVIIVRLFDKELGRLLSGNMPFTDWLRLVIYHAPERVMQAIPAASMLAPLFMVGRFSRSNELTAMKSAGISIYRIIAPMLGVTLLVSLSAIIFNDQVVSRANWTAKQLERRSRSPKDRNIFFKGQEGRFYYIQRIDMRSRTMRRLTLYELNGDELRLEVFADTVRWDDDRWTLLNGWSRHFEGGTEIEFQPFELYEIQAPVRPDLLAGSDARPSEMTYAALSQLVKYKKSVGQVTRKERVEMHHKIAYPFAAMVAVFIGAPLAIYFGQLGAASAFVITMFIQFLYWGIALATFEALGENGRLPAVVACWLPNLIFAAIGVFLLWQARRKA